MSPSTPPFHDLEFSQDPPRWPPGTEGRRVFLMPAADAALFVAFGAREEEVCFVARGSLGENLGPFLERMAKEEVSVGLYVQPPVSRDLLDTYGAPPPFEGHEFEGPPKPPINGVASDQVRLYPAEGGSSPWSSEDPAPRRVFLVPLREPATFLALGLLEDSDRVLFALQGRVREDLPRLLAHLRRVSCRVQLFALPPLPQGVLDTYLAFPPVP